MLKNENVTLRTSGECINCSCSFSVCASHKKHSNGSACCSKCNHESIEKRKEKRKIMEEWQKQNYEVKRLVDALKLENEELRKYKKFHDHIKTHLNDNQVVICTICRKTVEEIVDE